MAPGGRSEAQLTLSLSALSSPLDQLPATSRSPFGGAKALNGGTSGLPALRLGAGSPLSDPSSRLFPKRTRELQTSTGLSPNIWGPPTSGTSTPLFEIPESPSQDGFPDLMPVADSGIDSPARRGRAGTLPSRISPMGTIGGINVQSSVSRTSRPTPSTSPFKPPSSLASDSGVLTPQTTASNASLLSRLRAGSLPQRSSNLGTSSPFGQSVFSSSWMPRDRAATLTSIRSFEDPASPTQNGFAKDGLADGDVRTLDFLGLETPQQASATPFRSMGSAMTPQNDSSSVPQLLANSDLRNANRFRSFSVNAPQKYLDEKNDDSYSGYQSGTLTPSAAAAAADYVTVQQQIHLHNLQVQAFVANASAKRPRARTAGIIETPIRSSVRNVMQNSQDEARLASSMYSYDDDLDDRALQNSFQRMDLNVDQGGAGRDSYDENDGHASRSLWIGSIPVSTTVSSLQPIFGQYGPIESTRVLTHKNCGFVNYENVDDAIRARHNLNGKEIFPGAGPVRIGFAKAPSAANGTAANQRQPMTSEGDLNSNDLANHHDRNGALNGTSAYKSDNVNANGLSDGPEVSRLSDLQAEILRRVVDFGASDEDVDLVSNSIERSLGYHQLVMEIPPVAESSHTRTYDAPRLRDIRKRIDNGACSHQEIEEIAHGMLPEIAELSSDYLGNVVVQKLFEFCTEQTKDQMLTCVAPHLAEIGIHKNGTWAAQKIIETCKTESQMLLIVESLRPYTIPLFLDQYGNYVLQGCLRFDSPYNDFIFETMLSHLWEIAPGRFGSRAMRACLESHHATKNQQRMLAAAVALHSAQLATNTNGALLLTWFLDTCTFMRRRTVLAPVLIPHLVQLCTHKVAYLTVLKVIHQRNEPEARDAVLRALFFSPDDNVLEQILSDQASGATLIFKVLTTPFLDADVRDDVVQNVSKVLTRIKAQPNQGYKRLMDEVGLSRPAQGSVNGPQNHGHSNLVDRSRPMSQSEGPSYQLSHSTQRHYNGHFSPTIRNSALDNNVSPIRSGSTDPFSFNPYGLGAMSNQPTYSQMPMQQYAPQQLQYQNFLAASQRTNGNFMPNPSANAFSGYMTPPTSIDMLRGMQSHGSPLHTAAQMSPLMNGGGFAQPTYSHTMPGNMYSYQQAPIFAQQAQGVQNGGRRGRVTQPASLCGNDSSTTNLDEPLKRFDGM